MRRPIAAVALAVAAALAGCGGGNNSSGGKPLPTVVVALDFTPNAIHAPIYAAVRDGADRRHGVRIRIQTPGSQPDSLKTVVGGRADVGILDIQDLGLARERGEDVVGVGALVQRPLAALIARPGIRRPRDLTGRTVGVSGLPSDPAFVDAIVRHDGGDPRKIRQVTIGFAAVSALLSKRVDAVPAFWNAEGVVLRRRGLAVREFRVDSYGAPPFPEVVLMATRHETQARRDALRRFLAAVRDGARDVRAHPDAAVRDIARAAGSADPDLIRAQLRAVSPVVSPSLRVDREVARRWSEFAARIGILRRPVDIDRAFDFAAMGEPVQQGG